MTEGISGGVPPGQGRESSYIPVKTGFFEVDAIRAQETLDRMKAKADFADALKKEIGKVEAGAHEGKGKTNGRLLDVCYDMESIFIGTMFRAMRRTIDESDFLGKSIAKDIFRDMLYDEYANIMARTDQLGIARQLYAQLSGQKAL